jgi:hypothetical protein
VETDNFNSPGTLWNIFTELHTTDKKSYWMQHSLTDRGKYQVILLDMEMRIGFQGKNIDNPTIEFNSSIICVGKCLIVKR